MLDSFRNNSSIRKPAYGMVIGLILCSIFLFRDNLLSKLYVSKETIKQKNFYKPHQFDTYIDSNKDLFDAYRKNDKFFLLSIFDSYYYYRYNLYQPGFYTPFFSSVYIKDTLSSLIQRMNEGYRIVFWEDQVKKLIPLFNESSFMKEKNLTFVYSIKNSVYELELIRKKHMQ